VEPSNTQAIAHPSQTTATTKKYFITYSFDCQGYESHA
jgi:hypothetical protein